MNPTRHLAAFTDKALRLLAEKGDLQAQTEMVRRGLAGDPVLLKEAHTKGRRIFRAFGYNDRRD